MGLTLLNGTASVVFGECKHIGRLHSHNKLFAGVVVMPLYARLPWTVKLEKFVLSNIPIPVYACNVQCYMDLYVFYRLDSSIVLCQIISKCSYFLVRDDSFYELNSL